jgi:hypothetical protein
VHKYATHLPALLEMVCSTSGPVLEIGCGHYSTPILHAVLKPSGRALVSIESKLDWLRQFIHLQSEHHQLIHSTRLAECDRQWSVVFVDGLDRVSMIQRFRDKAEFIVVHDSNDDAPHRSLYKLEPTISSFIYRKDFTDLDPHTVVLSDRMAIP